MNINKFEKVIPKIHRLRKNMISITPNIISFHLSVLQNMQHPDYIEILLNRNVNEILFRKAFNPIDGFWLNKKGKSIGGFITPSNFIKELITGKYIVEKIGNDILIKGALKQK